MPENDQYFELKPVAISEFSPADFTPGISEAIFEDVLYNDSNIGLSGGTEVYAWSKVKTIGQRAGIAAIIEGANLVTSPSAGTIIIKCQCYTKGIYVETKNISYLTTALAQSGSFVALNDVVDFVKVCIYTNIAGALTAGSISAYLIEY